MLTLDDCNTIYNKYEYNNFFYKLSQAYNKPVDFLNTKLMINTSDCTLFYGLIVTNCFWTGGYYLKSKTTDEFYEVDLSDPNDEFGLNIPLDLWEDYDLYLHMAVNKYIDLSVVNLKWHPLSSLTMSVYDNDEFIPKKIYLDFHGHEAPAALLAGSYDFEEDLHRLSPTDVHQDSEGYYIDAVVDDFSKPLFAIVSTEGHVFYGKVNHLKRLPVLGADKLYKGTPQKIKIKTIDGNYIDRFQAYYQGRKLQDNIIDLAYDVDDVIDITVDLLDPNYPNSTLKLKVATELYEVSSQAELETVIEQGIRTIKITSFTLENISLNDLLIVNSNFTVNTSTLENVNILDSALEIGEDVIFNNCEISGTTLNNTLYSTIFNNCRIIESIIEDMELHYTGAITNTTLTNSLIISDGAIEVRGNIFNGAYSKEYFPSYLYVTGDYFIRNNTFNLTGEWEELQYNMCIIKTLQGFSPNELINANNFNLNITYDSEDPNTFYYNIVDDDKIRAVRLL